MGAKNKRSDYLVNPRFQLTFLAYVGGIGLVITTIFYAAYDYSLWKIHQSAQEMGLGEGHPLMILLAEQSSQLDIIFLLTALLLFVLLLTLGLDLSHRVAGPMYRLQRHLKALAHSGKLTPVKFREKDYFQEVSLAFNDLVQRKDSSDSPRNQQ